MLSTLAESQAEFGGQSVSVLDLIESWAFRAGELAAVSGVAGTPGATSRSFNTAYDLIGALIIRDVIESTALALDAMTPHPAVLRNADLLFKISTIEVADSFMTRLARAGLIELPPNPAWWWSREPASGYLRIEIDEMPNTT